MSVLWLYLTDIQGLWDLVFVCHFLVVIYILYTVFALNSTWTQELILTASGLQNYADGGIKITFTKNAAGNMPLQRFINIFAVLRSEGCYE